MHLSTLQLPVTYMLTSKLDRFLSWFLRPSIIWEYVLTHETALIKMVEVVSGNVEPVCSYGSGHGIGAVLLPGFAIKW